MIVKTRYAGDVEVRDIFSAINTSPATGMSILAHSGAGQRVTTETASGLPAVGQAIRFNAGMVASLRMTVYEGQKGDRRERDSTWQAKLLAQPCTGSTFDWLWDVVTALEGYENALIQKIKKNGKVVELYPLSLDNAKIYRDRYTKQKVIQIGAEKYSTSDILHIRGQTVGPGLVGVSRIWQHRDPVGAMLAAQKFEGKFYMNDARPGVAFIFPQDVKREQAKEWKTEIENEYGGTENSWKPFVAGGGVTISPIPISLEDAQFIEGKQMNVEDVGRVMDTDPVLIGGMKGIRGERDEAMQRYLAMQLPPRLKRITDALKADPDLFGVTPIYPGFVLNDLTFVDPVKRAQIIHEKIQDGTFLPDEARAEEGRGPLPPVPDDWKQAPGMVPQITPVGGTPNPASGTPNAQEV